MTPAHFYLGFWIVGLILLSLNPSQVSSKDAGTLVVLLGFGFAGWLALALAKRHS